MLGASSASLFELLTKEFLILILIAVFIGVPASIFGLQSWLENFAYHINLNFWLFVSGSLITLVISLITIGSQVAKAVLSNPVKSLKDE